MSVFKTVLSRSLSILKGFNAFIPLAIIAFFGGMFLWGKLREDSMPKPELPVMISDSKDLEKYDIDDIPDLHFLREDNGVYFFTVKRGYFYPHDPSGLKLQSTSMFGSSSIYPSQSVVNLLMHEPDGAVRRLFDRDTWIIEVDFPTESKYSNDLSAWVFRVIEEDTNSDGFLRLDDEVDLYVADRRGRNLRKILDDIQSVELVADDVLLVGRSNISELQHFEYRVDQGTLRELFRIDRETL